MNITIKELSIDVARPAEQSSEDEKAQRRIRFSINGRSSGYLTVNGVTAMELAAIVSRGCRELGVDFTMHRAARPKPAGAPQTKERAHG